MVDQFINGIGSFCIVVLAGIGMIGLHKLSNKQIRQNEDSLAFLVFKISRVTGHSEYDVFCKSAEEWPVAAVSRKKIDADFRIYMSRSAVPPYVQHYVRQNKRHIDELNLPPY